MPRSCRGHVKSATGCAAFLDLAATADIVTENFRPGVTERLGVGPASGLRYVAWILYLTHPDEVAKAVAGFITSL